MADRMAWRFDGNLSHDLRSPRVLEHIAYYLDRIDRHLERIADTFSRDEPNDVTALKALAISPRPLRPSPNASTSAAVIDSHLLRMDSVSCSS
jgi:hypothetical protein